MKRYNYLQVMRKHKVEETQIKQERQKVVITIGKKKENKNQNIKKEPLPFQQIDLQGFET